MRFRLSPTTLIACTALFFALGGSALALSDAVRPQARCASGAVRGIAMVTGGGNIPGEFTSNKSFFGRTFNCSGRPVQVRRVGPGAYEVRFAGNSAQSAVANGVTGNLASVEPVAGGAFKVSLYVAGRDDEADVPFVIVAL